MRKTRNIIIIILLCLFLIFGLDTISEAKLNISPSKSTVSPGDSFSVTVSVDSNEAGHINLSVSNGSLDTTNIDLMSSSSSTVTCTAGNSGTVSISGSGKVANYSTETEEKQSASASVEIASSTSPETPTEPAEPAPKVPSSKAYLTNLIVKPVDFSGFRSGTFESEKYTVTVDNDVTEVKIVAYPAENGTYSVEGNKNLKEGTNIVKVTVKSEDGTKTNTYKVTVIRKVAGEEVDTPEDVADTAAIISNAGLSKLEITGMTFTPEFSTNIYRYIVELKEDEELTLEKLKELIVAEVNFEGGTFEVLGDEKLDKQKNEVVISIKDQDGRELAIYTIVFEYPEVEDTAEVVATGINISDFLNLSENQLIVIGTIAFLFLVAFFSSISAYKKRKLLKKNGLLGSKANDEYIEEKEDEEIEEVEESPSEIQEEKPLEEEEKKDYISDIFANKQMEFEADEKDFVKNKKAKRGKGKHSS